MPHEPKMWFRPARGKWYVTIDQVQHCLGSDETLARQQYHKLLAAPPEPPKPKPVSAATSLAVLFDQFLDWCQHEREPETYRWYQKRIESFLRFHPGLTVEALQPYHVKEWVRSHPDWADGQKRGAMIAVQRPLNWALEEGRIKHSPIASMRKPSQGKRQDVISPEEYGNLLTLVRDAAFRDLLTVSYETGCPGCRSGRCCSHARRSCRRQR